ncbi:hypothetical protein V8C37DRAFT_397407 [Trichoderma ceciliae]
MPYSIVKQQSSVEKKLTRNRKAAVLVIETIGIVVMPCSYCKAKGIVCWCGVQWLTIISATIGH